MDTAFGKDYTETLTSASGETQRLMGMESIHGVTEIDLRESGRNASNMEMGLTYSAMEMRILDITGQGNLTDMDSIFGRMEAVMLASLGMA
jgi:hypothetical protein